MTALVCLCVCYNLIDVGLGLHRPVVAHDDARLRASVLTYARGRDEWLLGMLRRNGG